MFKQTLNKCKLNSHTYRYRVSPKKGEVGLRVSLIKNQKAEENTLSLMINIQFYFLESSL